jgi:Spy/CpxP family protein refolding chaperone
VIHRFSGFRPPLGLLGLTLVALIWTGGGGLEAALDGVQPPQAAPRPPAGDAGQSGQRGGAGGGQRTSPRTPGLGTEWEWWKDQEFIRTASLTPEKSQFIDRIFQNRQRLMRPIAEGLQKELAVLDRMTRERVAPDEEYQLQVIRVETLWARLRESRMVMFYRMYRELTPEQYKQLESARQRRRDGRGGGSSPR